MLFSKAGCDYVKVETCFISYVAIFMACFNFHRDCADINEHCTKLCNFSEFYWRDDNRHSLIYCSLFSTSHALDKLDIHPPLPVVQIILRPPPIHPEIVTYTIVHPYPFSLSIFLCKF